MTTVLTMLRMKLSYLFPKGLGWCQVYLYWISLSSQTFWEQIAQLHPQQEMISFLRDEMEKSRKHELKLFQLMLGTRANSGMPPSSSMEAGFYPSWNQGSAYHETGFYPPMQSSLGAQQTTQERMSEGSYGNPFLYGNGKFQTL